MNIVCPTVSAESAAVSAAAAGEVVYEGMNFPCDQFAQRFYAAVRHAHQLPEIVRASLGDHAEYADVADHAEILADSAARTEPSRGVFDFADVALVSDAGVYRDDEAVTVAFRQKSRISGIVYPIYGSLKSAVYVCGQTVLIFEKIRHHRA